ncbi:alkaline phosphatase family protein [Halosimplex litoreum]|uniref:Alkaline phosphatase family protein n=1 Tax=Halosimplex litoreum TaxID=1198301 RepID=A0A7T3KWH5_9EURY|nr:alkaline phosphatase family protein [Halosimplex litoreum]QPV64347.1 alkaline phosphatase family protein [Halosimplex litoreum]
METLVIGWDAATSRHLSQFDLPFWESLSENGRLLPEHPFDEAGYISSANAWTTISTGAPFSEHGMLGFVYGPYSDHPLSGPIRSLATQTWLPPLVRRILIGRVLGALGAGTKGEKGDKVDSTNIPYKRFWEYIDGDGLVYGLPLTYPIRETNGVVVSGIPAPKFEEASNPVVYPERLEETVYDGDDAGYYVEQESPVNDPSVQERPYCDRHLRRMEANAEKYVELYEKLSPERDLEVGFLMFRGLDDIMHATEDTSIIRDAYELVDRLTGDVVDAIDPDTTLVLSDHGMRPASDYRPDKDMRMDHDTTQGVWGATEPFELERHVDVTPAILDRLQVDCDVPEKRDSTDTVTSDLENEVIHERLEDLGYA